MMRRDEPSHMGNIHREIVQSNIEYRDMKDARGRGTLAGATEQEKRMLEERLSALGFDAAKKEIVRAWQQLEAKVDTGAHHGKGTVADMDFIAWYLADSERAKETKERPPDRHPYRQGDPDRDR